MSKPEKWEEMKERDKAYAEQSAKDKSPRQFRKVSTKQFVPDRIPYHFVPVPQEIWNTKADMTLVEFFLIGYLLRHAVLNKSTVLFFQDDELLNGRRSRNGDRLDIGCGVQSRNGLKIARNRLRERGWIDDAKVPIGRRYEILLLQQMLFTKHERSTLTPDDQRTREVSSEFDELVRLKKL